MIIEHVNKNINIKTGMENTLSFVIRMVLSNFDNMFSMSTFLLLTMNSMTELWLRPRRENTPRLPITTVYCNQESMQPMSFGVAL